MAPRAGAACFVALCAGLPGCSYPDVGFAPGDASGAETSTDTSSEGNTGSDALDANDSPSLDGSVDGDAVIDGALDSDVSSDSGTVCKHTFCADFDSVTAPEDGWTGSFTVGGGALSLDKLTFVSAGASLRSQVPIGTSTDIEWGADLNKNFTTLTATPTARAEMDILTGSASYGGTGIVLMKISRGGSAKGVDLSVGSTGLAVNIPGNTFAVGRGAPLGWFHVRLDVVLSDATSGTVQLYIDDMTKPVLEKIGVATATVTGSEVRLIVGLYTDEKSTGFKANFDNVTFDLK